MNLESEQRCSLEELKQRNSPQLTLPQWTALLQQTQSIQQSLAEQANTLNRLVYRLDSMATAEQMEKILEELQSIRWSLPAGNGNERFFSLPKPRLPRIRFSPWILLIPILLAVFLATCWSLVTLWRNLSQMFL